MKIERFDIANLEDDPVYSGKLPLIFNSLGKTILYKQKNADKNKIFNTVHYNLYPLYKPICICMDLSVKMKVVKLY